MAAEGYPIKLVRDKVRDLDCVHDGLVQIWATGRTSHVRLLKQKLLEEVGEYIVGGGAEELADVQEVVEALAKVAEGVSRNQLDEIKRQKLRERGGFMGGHVMYAYPPEVPGG